MRIALENDNGLDFVHVTMSDRQNRQLNKFLAERGRRGVDGCQFPHSLLDGDVDWSIELVLEFATKASAKGCTENFLREVNRLRKSNPKLGLRVTNGPRFSLKLGPFHLAYTKQGTLHVTPPEKKSNSN